MGIITVKNRGQMAAALSLMAGNEIRVAGTNFVLFKHHGKASKTLLNRVNKSARKLWEVKR